MSEKRVRVLLVDDEKLIRQAMGMLLSMDARIEIIGEAEDGAVAVEMNRQNPADVILMDVRMPNMDGREATRIICEESDSQVLILTTFNDMQYIQDALRFGAKGYLLKDSSPELVAESIVAVAKGSVVVHPDIASKFLDHSSPDDKSPNATDGINSEAKASTEVKKQKLAEQLDLSSSELEIIEFVASGHSNREIAESLFLSEGTVKNKLSIILQKLDLRDRTQLAIFAWREGFNK